jgi:lysozyme
MMNILTLRDELVDLWRKDLGQRETNGKNRSPMIDAINERLGVAKGSPYCIGGLLVRGVEVLCKKHGLKNPVTMTAGTQNFYNKAPAKYKHAKGVHAKKGDIGILVNKDDAGHGHAFGFREEQVTADQRTIEYNTNGAGSRDGDGVFELERTDLGTLTKTYRGSVDVIQWIMDANGMADGKTAVEPVKSGDPLKGIPGIDVSHHEGVIDWKKVAAAGYKFAIMKATERDDFKDDKFALNVRGARANGLLVGAYHFFKPSVDAQKQANWFLNNVAGAKCDLPYILDWEKDDHTGSADEVKDAQVILDLFEKAQGRVPWIYTGDWYFKNISHVEQFKRYPLWLSDYSPSAIKIPKPWDKVTMLQYTSSGIVPGIKGHCDLNVYYGAIEGLKA